MMTVGPEEGQEPAVVQDAREIDQPTHTGPAKHHGRDRLFRSLVATCAVLTVSVVALVASTITLQSNRSDEQATADQAIHQLGQDLRQLEEERAAETLTLDSTKQALEDSEAALADASTRLEQARSEVRSMEQLFPIDLRDLGDVPPAGRFTMTSDIESCTGWSSCGEEKWETRFPSLTITCSATCSVGSLTKESAQLTFDVEIGTWSASGPFPVTCKGTDSDGQWSLEIQPVGLTLDNGDVAIDQLTGTLDVTASTATGCRAAKIAYQLDAGRR